VLWVLLFCTVTLQVMADEPSAHAPAALVDQSVISSLPNLREQTAVIVAHLDLTKPFDTKSQWTFVAAILPGSHVEGASEDPVNGGPLTQCFVRNLRPNCTYTKAEASSNLDYSTPIDLYSAEVVFRGADSTRPLLMIKTGGSHSGDGGHIIHTDLFMYDGQKDAFESVFSNVTGSNNNQQTRYVRDGPLRGDLIVDTPSGCCYRIEVYRQDDSGRYARILAYRSHTVYGDGNPLSVSDSEMPEILRRLGFWHQGDPLPIPHPGCTPVMRRGEEWCQ